MSLRKSPTRTPALLAANRANAPKSAEPRTPEGKSMVALNSLLPARYRGGLRGGKVMGKSRIRDKYFPKQTHQVVENTDEVSGIGQNNPKFGTVDAGPRSTCVRLGRRRGPPLGRCGGAGETGCRGDGHPGGRPLLG
jgi:hypothetical protein